MSLPVYLKWAGGKTRLLDAIDEAFMGPCERTWIEPFTGSAVVFLSRAEQGLVRSAVLSDSNAALMTLHRTVRDDSDALLECLEGLPCGPDFVRHYCAVRDRFNEALDGLGPDEVNPRVAADFLWLNRACFNGLYRVNRDGHFNVPSGDYDTVDLPAEDVIRKASSLLDLAEIVAEDFTESLGRAEPGDQVYADPPYVPASLTSSFTAYTSEGFGWPEQVRLCELGKQAAWKGATVVLSNHDIPLVHKLYEDHGYVISSFSVSRSISSGPRGSALELLAVQ